MQNSSEKVYGKNNYYVHEINEHNETKTLW